MVSLLKAIILLFMLLWGAGCSSSSDASIQASGTVEAKEVNVGAEVGGQVVSLLVEEGDSVKKGQEIARIDDTVLKWQVAQAEAAAEAAEARLGETKKGSRMEEMRQAESAVKQMQALKEGAEASFKAAQDNYVRIKELLDQGAATKQQYDEAEANWLFPKANTKQLSPSTTPPWNKKIGEGRGYGRNGFCGSGRIQPSGGSLGGFKDPMGKL